MQCLPTAKVAHALQESEAYDRLARRQGVSALVVRQMQPRHIPVRSALMCDHSSPPATVLVGRWRDLLPMPLLKNNEFLSQRVGHLVWSGIVGTQLHDIIGEP